MNEDEGGRKDDTGKLRMDLIPPEAMEGLASILTYGANKYEDRNWEKGINYSRVYGALLRHLTKWAKGEKIDDESGLSALDHAFCNLAFLVTFERRKMDKFNDLFSGNIDNDVYSNGRSYTNNKITDSGRSLGAC
jgi:hypothetical protein